ncbi:hypothetical protein BGZ82_010787 [Podila clonocystis]|nr:hypothetical protein BGZ82_010787 [Podila clonocystis]
MASSSQDVPYPAVDEHLGERLQKDEAQIATATADTIEAGIRNQYHAGDARRDVHAKATGVVKANFRVHDNIPADLAKGVFIPGKAYQSLIRFSNAAGNAHQKDDHDDGRGIAIKLLDVPGPKILESDKDAKTQDFLLINAPVFLTNDAKTYLQLMQKAGGGALAKLSIPFTLGFKGTINAARLMAGRISNPLQIQYFSVVPAQLGLGPDRQAVKYSVKPVSNKKDPFPGINPEHDYLHTAIKRNLLAETVEFRFMIQRKKGEHMDVEDSMVEWSQAESPYVEVATVTIPQQDIDAGDLDALGERLSFNPWHSLPDHKPLGAMNRFRKVVYERISRVRDSMNSVPRQEPS